MTTDEKPEEQPKQPNSIWHTAAFRRALLASALAVALAKLVLLLSTGCAQFIAPQCDVYSLFAEFAQNKNPLLAVLHEHDLDVPLLILAALIGVPLFSGAWLKRLDLVLLAPFDDKTLKPLPQQTGLLHWTLCAPPKPRPGDNAAAAVQSEDPATFQRKIWDDLRNWAMEGKGERHWSWFWFAPEIKPFAWALLLGPNGVGKTQLALELGKHLAQAERQARLSSADPDERRAARRAIVAAWLRRWNCRARRRDDDAWDAALWPNNVAPALLNDWRPRRPTLLIVDEPCERDWKLIDTLEANAGQFCQPVRLLFIDQCQPLREPGKGATFRLRAFKFTLDNVRPLRLTADSVEVLSNSKELQTLLDAVDGDPLLTAFAAHWLTRPGNMLHQLTLPLAEAQEASLSPAKAQEADPPGLPAPAAAHRLLDDRMHELLQTFRRDSVKLWKAIGCATLAGGLSLDEALEAFGFDEDTNAIARLFPHQTNPYKLPPLTPARIGDRFLTHTGHGLPHLLSKDNPHAYRAELAKLVSLAWQLNPSGTRRNWERHSKRWALLSVAEREHDLLGQVLLHPLNLPQPADAEHAYRLARAFAELAILEDGDLPAALTLLARLDADGTDKLLAALAGPLPDSAAPAFIDRAEADYLPLTALYCAAATRVLAHSPTDPARLEAILATLQRMLPHVGERGHPLAGHADCLFAAFANLLQTPALQALALEPTGPSRLHHALAVPLFDIPWFVRQKLAAPLAGQLAEQFAAAQPWAALWAVRAAVLALDVDACLSLAPTVAAEWHEGQCWLAHALAHVYGWTGQAAQGRAQAEKLDVLATADDSDAPLLRAEAWAVLAVAYAEVQRDAASIHDIIAKLETLALPADTATQSRGINRRAYAWGQLALAYSQQEDRENTRLAGAQIAALDTPDAAGVGRLDCGLLIEAYQRLAYAHGQHNDLPPTAEAVWQIEQVLQQVGRVGQHNRLMQYQRALAWDHLAKVFSYLGGSDPSTIAAAAERLGLRLQSGLSPNIAAAQAIAALQQQRLGQGYWQQDAELQARLAEAWLRQAVAHSEVGAVDWVGLKAAVAQVEHIADRPQWAAHQGIQSLRLHAWAALTYAYSRLSEADKIRALLRRAAPQARHQPWRRETDIQRPWIILWRQLAWAYYRLGKVAKTAQAVRRVEGLAARPGFRDDSLIQEDRAESWLALLAVHADRQDFASARLALARLADIARPWPQDATMQLTLARGHEALARRQRILQPTDAAEAARQTLALCARFPHHPQFQALAQQAQQHLPPRWP